MKKGKSTICFPDGRVCASAKIMAEVYGVKLQTVYACCNDIQQQHKGMMFCYVEDVPVKMNRIAEVIKTQRANELRKQLAEAEKKRAQAIAARDRILAELAAVEATCAEISAKLSQ